MTALTFPRYFTSENQHPFDAVPWEVRDAVIMGKDGQPVFEALRVEFPAFWSQRATDIVASKYFRVIDGKRETSVKHMISRIVNTIGIWGQSDDYFEGALSTTVFMQELDYILLNQYASFNSPVWFNVGVQEYPQTSACYILDVEDNMESILEWYRQEGMIFKGGSGSGVNLSKIRAKGLSLSNGGVASGVMSFARVADANAGTIKSGGSTRRAAKLLVLNADHLEIEDFIQCKVTAERLAQTLMKLGYGSGIEGGAYDQVPWQNANNSVSVSDDFMQLATLPGPAGEKGLLLRKIAKAAWECGDPGLFFQDTINKWHTTPLRGPIISGNPCQEFLRPPNEACNLASLNLLRFLKDDGSFDIPAFTHTVDIMITAMDIMIDRSSYPTEVIAQNSKAYRPLGLGYSNLGAFLMAKGLPYDSDEGRALAASITALMTGEAYRQSGYIAAVKGAFTEFSTNEYAMLNVVENHRLLIFDAPQNNKTQQSDELISCADDVLDGAIHLGEKRGFRNCQVTVLAPCGTISFMMDCDTTGIEPCLGLVTKKKLVGGGEITMVNGAVERALRTLGYDDILSLLKRFEHPFLGNPIGCPDLDKKHLPVFATALGNNLISWQGHIKMVAAVQPFISGGISKTVNMPHNVTVEDVYDAYVFAWHKGLKAISIYRDGSKEVQPVTVGDVKKKELSDTTKKEALILPSCMFWEENAEALRMLDEAKKLAPLTLHSEDFPRFGAPQRLRLSDERQAITHKFTINMHEGYLTVGLYPDGRPGELFVRMAKEGSTLSGLIDAWATVMSIALQYGVPFKVLTTKLKGTRYEPAGFTGNSDVRTASSITDYIAQWMEKKFMCKIQHAEMPVVPNQDVWASVVSSSQQHAAITRITPDASSAPTCAECGAITARNGSCYLCMNCGATTGCS